MALTWGTNISLNLLYVLKRFVPETNMWDRPIDGGINFFDGKRMIGDSTTLLGFVVAALCSLIAFYGGLFDSTVSLLTPFLVYVGHLIGSFIKRRMNKNNVFVPFVDHGDYMFLSGLVLVIFGFISFKLAIVCLLLTYILHPVAVLVATLQLGAPETAAGYKLPAPLSAVASAAFCNWLRTT